VQEVPHPLFERKTNDLKIQMHITLREALLGFVKTITHLDGHEVVVNRQSIVTKPGLMVRLKGEGMPVYGAYGDFGDMLVTCIVNLPEELTEEQK
jgi:DnaJ-class molecular chaperone